MKTGKYIAIVAVLASGLSLSAFAKDKNETRISLSDSVQLGTTGLKPGDYTLQWEGNGPDVQGKVLKGKNLVGTVPAKLAQNGSKHADAISTSTVGDVETLDEVDFAGGKRSLVFEGGTGTQSGGQE
jgi:hypothetical protein